MIVIKDKVENKIEYPIEKFGDTDKIIYFDIETTGFSRKYSMIYLIGCMYFVGGKPYYNQWFAENANEEANILMAFHKFLKNFKIIIHFNGNSFDMPFIKERGEKYRLDFDFSNFTSIDIFKSAKKYSHILNLENNKQKSYENFLGIKRKDPFSGGDLVEVYKEFLRTKDEMLIFPLLLHNKEDVWYMGSLTSLFSIENFFNCEFETDIFEIRNYKTMDGDTGKELFIQLKLDVPFSFSLSHKTDNVYLKIENNTAKLTVTSPHLLLKYFFKDYKDYYYLPEEDMAVHKSVASYVDKEFRVKALASNCYTKVTDNFLPIYTVNSDVFHQIFIENYGDKSGFIQLSNINEDNISDYIKCVLSYVS